MNDSEPTRTAPAIPPLSSVEENRIRETLLQRGAFDPPAAPGSLGRLDRFEILRLLGEGGMGLVYLAREPTTQARVAIKLMKPRMADDPQAVHRFLTEARHMYRLSHPRILRVLEVSDRKECPYYVMPYIAGGDLRGVAQSGQTLSRDRALTIARQVAEALAHAHGHGLIHRDLKPGNVLLDKEGNAFLTDFGLVRTVFNDSMIDPSASHLEGTAPYMSPAVARGEAEDTRCDIYAFGALLYEMLAGQPPYTGRTPQIVLDHVLKGPPKPIREVNPKADLPLTRIAEGCMARELCERYATMGDVVADLDRAAKGISLYGPHPKRRSMARLAAVAAVSLAAVGLGWSVVQSKRAARSPRPAPREPVAALPTLTPESTASADNTSDATTAAQSGRGTMTREFSPVWPNTRLRFVRLQHGGDGWDAGMNSGAEASFLRHVRDITGMDVTPRGEFHVPGSLNRYAAGQAPPFLFITGTDGVRMDDSEKQSLRRYVENGGMIVAAGEGPVWVSGFHALMKGALPGAAWGAIPPDDPLFGEPFVLASGAAVLRDTSGYLPVLEGLKLGTRWCAVSCSRDLMKLCSDLSDDQDAARTDAALKLWVNILHYALARRKDQRAADAVALPLPQDPLPFRYAKNNGGVTVTTYLGLGGDVVVPERIEGLPVSAIGPLAFVGCTGLTGLTLPSSVTMIGGTAISRNDSLTRVTLQEGLKTIRAFAFEANPKLEELTIPASVDVIEQRAFSYCKALRSVFFEGDAPSTPGPVNTLFHGNPDTTVYYRPRTKGWGITFSGRPTAVWAEQEPGTPPGVQQTAESDLPVIPDIRAFDYKVHARNCAAILAYTGSVPRIALPSSIHGLQVTQIGTQAFKGNTNLLLVVIPASVSVIGANAFENCTRLCGVSFPEGLTQIGGHAFANTALSHVDIPSSVTTIENRAFGGCTGLTAIAVRPGNPTYSSTEDGVLFDKSHKRLLACPGGMTGDYTVPEGVTAVGREAFYMVRGLTAVTLPESVTHLGLWAFSGCAGLRQVRFKGKPPICDGDVFGSATRATVFHPSGLAGWGREFGGRPTAPWQPKKDGNTP